MYSIDAIPEGWRHTMRPTHRIERVRSALLALGFGAVLLPTTASAGWMVNGVAVAPADGSQIDPRIVPDGANGAIITWEDDRGGRRLAYAQRLADDGSPAAGWPAGGILLPNRGFSQHNPTLITDGAGGAFAASDDSDFVGVVMVHHLGHDGLPASGWPSGIVAFKKAPYGQPGGTQGSFLPALLADGSGGVFVARTYRDRLHQSIALTRLSASADFDPGWDSGAFAGSASSWDFPSVLCSDGHGGVFVALREYYGHRMLIEQFTGFAGKVFGPDTVSLGPLDQFAPGLVSDGDSGAVVVWEDHRNGVFDQVYAKRILSNGTVAPGWPATGVAVCSYSTEPGKPSDFIFPGPLSSVESDGAGGAYVAWTDHRGNATEGDIYAQRVLGDGTIAPGWPLDGLAICAAPGDQERPTIAADGQGGVLVTWQDARSGGYDIYAQRVDATGVTPPGWPSDGLPVCTAEGDQRTPQITGDGAAGAVIAWADGRGPRTQIYASRVTFDGVVSTLASLVSAIATSGNIRLEWLVTSAGSGEIGVERRTASTDWIRIAQVARRSDGRIVFEDRDVEPGRRYGYRLPLGPQGYGGETWISTLGDLAFELDQPRPNPVVNAANVSFSLPDAMPARIEVFDVGGRRLLAREVGSLGAGRHVMSLVPGIAPSPGLYLLRLSRGTHALTRRFLVTR